jgi:hypothetical protein
MAVPAAIKAVALALLTEKAKNGPSAAPLRACYTNP